MCSSDLHENNIHERETQMRAYVATGFHHPRLGLDARDRRTNIGHNDRPEALRQMGRDGLHAFAEYNRDTGIQHDSYNNGVANYVNLDTYNIELRDSHRSPEAWLTYLSNTDVLPEPILDSVDPATFECTPVYSPAFVQRMSFDEQLGMNEMLTAL